MSAESTLNNTNCGVQSDGEVKEGHPSSDFHQQLECPSQHWGQSLRSLKAEEHTEAVVSLPAVVKLLEEHSEEDVEESRAVEAKIMSACKVYGLNSL